jgi:hypothetical protein
VKPQREKEKLQLTIYTTALNPSKEKKPTVGENNGCHGWIELATTLLIGLATRQAILSIDPHGAVTGASRILERGNVLLCGHCQRKMQTR